MNAYACQLGSSLQARGSQTRLFTSTASMAQIDDLPDDCLIEVLDRLSPGQLFKMQRVNKRLNRLAEVKMRTNIKAITWLKGNELFRGCHNHFGFSSENHVLFVGRKFKNPYQQPERRSLLLILLTKCTGIKSLDFVFDFNLPSDFLFEVVRLCPELECFKLVDAMVKEEDWSRLLNQIGHKIVHFEVRLYKKKPRNAQVHQKMLATVAEKCSNIKRVDWYVSWPLFEDVVSVLKMLPNNCWVTLKCKFLTEDVFEDVIDELMISNLHWSVFANLITRLSKFCFSGLTLYGDEPVRGVEFANLKYLEFNGVIHNPKCVSCLIYSQFPCLEEFNLSANGNLNETDYDGLFENMRSVKKLTIQYKVCFPNKALLPQSSVRRLVNLDTIILDVMYFPSDWDPSEFVKKIPPYVDWISSLKKLIFKVEETLCHRNEETLVEGVKRMQIEEAKKKKRVEIDLIFEK